MYLRSANHGDGYNKANYDQNVNCARGAVNVDETCLCGKTPNTKPYVESGGNIANGFQSNSVCKEPQISQTAIGLTQRLSGPPRPNKC